MRKIFYILLMVVLFCQSCDWQVKTREGDQVSAAAKVRRYDRLQTRYLTTGEFSVLQQLNTDYAQETRTLLEDVLELGEVNDPEIHARFLNLFQDSVLQIIMSDAEMEFGTMDDIEKEIETALHNMRKHFPNLKLPVIYAQVGTLKQSIVVDDNRIGVSLDKYLGEEYPFYLPLFSHEERKTMTREFVVPDCLCFYLLAAYPMKQYATSAFDERRVHMGKTMYVVNKLLGRDFFKQPDIKIAEKYMKRHPKTTLEQLLATDCWRVIND